MKGVQEGKGEKEGGGGLEWNEKAKSGGRGKPEEKQS